MRFHNIPHILYQSDSETLSSKAHAMYVVHKVNESGVFFFYNDKHADSPHTTSTGSSFPYCSHIMAHTSIH